MADVLIKNGLVVTPEGERRADLLMRDGLIAAIGLGIEAPAGAETIDAEGLLVLPGGVDVHTHFDLTVGSARVSDGWFAGSRAAAYGGTTSVVEHPGFGPKGCSLHHQLARYRENAAESAVVDYGLHGVFQHWNPSLAPEAAELVQGGYPSFKTYMTYDGRLTDGEFASALKAVGEAGGLMAVHAENHGLVTFLAGELRVSAPHLAASHPRSRPGCAEAAAVETALALALAAGDAPLYIVHLSTAQGLSKVRAARRAGRRVWAETCPQYLILTDDCYEGDFNQALKYVMAPTPRKRADVEALWEGLADGSIAAVATDHCSFAWAEKKARAKGDVFKCPGGIPGAETRLPLLYSEGVVRRGLSLARFAELASGAPARLFGLSRKGEITPGFDADVVLFDPGREKRLTAESLHQAVDYTPFENMTVRGWPRMVFLRGRKIIDGESFSGGPGQGKFIARRPFQYT